MTLMLKAVHSQQGREEAMSKLEHVTQKLTLMKLPKAAELVRTGGKEALVYHGFQSEHWRRIRANNPHERLMREIRRRKRVFGNPGRQLGADARQRAAALRRRHALGHPSIPRQGAAAADATARGTTRKDRELKPRAAPMGAGAWKTKTKNQPRPDQDHHSSRAMRTRLCTQPFKPLKDAKVLIEA